MVGDIQGCYKGLTKLLKKAKFTPYKDKLWAVGDLVARGPDSLKTLEYLYDLGPHFDTVLGNHDLHLIAGAHGLINVKPQDKLDKLFKHKHFNKYIEFLMTKPLALKPVDDVLITHAGLHPSWSFNKAIKLSDEIQAQLRSKHASKFLKNMYGNLPNAWSKELTGYARNRFIVNAFTRMRYLHHDKSLDFKVKSHPKNAPASLTPWFKVKNPKIKSNQTILFGHWASLLGDVPMHQPNKASLVALDTGYVWGNQLSLYCIDTGKVTRYQA